MGQFQRSFCTPLVGSAVVVHFYLAKCFLESRVWPEIVQIVTQDEFISIIMSRAGKVLVMELSNHARCTILPISGRFCCEKLKPQVWSTFHWAVLTVSCCICCRTTCPPTPWWTSSLSRCPREPSWKMTWITWTTTTKTCSNQPPLYKSKSVQET